MNSSKNSRPANPAKNSRRALGPELTREGAGAQVGAHTHAHTQGAQDAGTGTTATTAQTPTPEELGAKLRALKAERRKAVARGVALVVAPPVVLCVPLLILRGCNLLLLSWAWCFAPLLLLLIPLCLFFYGYFNAVKVWRKEQHAHRAKAAENA